MAYSFINNTIHKKYRATGKRTFKEGEQTSYSEIEMIISPKGTSLFGKSQKIEFCRTIKTPPRGNEQLESFIQDSSKIIEKFTLNVDSKNIPRSIDNYKELYKKWFDIVEILTSKYKGDWAQKQISFMTCNVLNQNEFFTAILNDFIIYELYQRHFYTIKFDDRTRKFHRLWTENMWGVPVIINQECTSKILDEQDILEITGKVDLDDNKRLIDKLSSSQLKIDEIESIEQYSKYTSGNITYMPDYIQSMFTVKTTTGISKEILTEIFINEISEL